MIDEAEINCAVAELLGWQWKDSNLTEWGATVAVKKWHDPTGKIRHRPEYTKSLDACREFEEPLWKEGKLCHYHQAIGALLAKNNPVIITERSIFMAPPLTRCQAFLLFHGKEVAS